MKHNLTSFINPQQLGGIESYQFTDGPARGNRALVVNTGGGLCYRILPDRGLDIEQAFLNGRSLTFLAHRGVMPPMAEALGRGLDWLKGFGVGLLTSCGPTNTGGPVNDGGQELGLHGAHSGTAATIESVIQPDPRSGRLDMSVTAVIRTGAFYGPCIELRRTITSRLGENWIDVRDEFFNAGNEDQPHAWLLHINLGYPLCDEGSMFCVDAKEVVPLDDPAIRTFYAGNWKRIPKPMKAHHGPNSAVAYLYPRAIDKAGMTVVGVVNKKLKMGLAIRYNTKEFPRCANWQHWGEREYVGALEPANGGVEGRDVDRRNGWMDTIKAGGRKSYAYRLEVVDDAKGLGELLRLNTI